mmetsp:Transcript_16610/g.35070  ORF Transcript_16610/g.35070 Transcript_16610/m.35070 type:complete len:236 (+) Transcript_16610:113-820(+)
MSTGSELLRRLRKQSHPPQHSQEPKRTHSRESCGNGVSRFIETNTAASPLADVESSRNDAASANTNLKSSKATTIEVCLGPDCSGSGGGAALLEIEELVMALQCKPKTINEINNAPSPIKPTAKSTIHTKHSSNKIATVTVIPGGCRDFCTMGPNVHIQNDKMNEHHTKVDDPSACRKIVESIFDNDTMPGDDKSSSSAATSSSILQRREEGIRWRNRKKRAAMEKRLRVRERST